jgi:hypothetical protein
MKFVYCVYIFRKTGSAIYRYKINSNVEMLKDEVNINVGNSSEDDVYKFIVGWLIDGGNLWKVWRSKWGVFVLIF